jgi:hypothetical protein
VRLIARMAASAAHNSGLMSALLPKTTKQSTLREVGSVPSATFRNAINGLLGCIIVDRVVNVWGGSLRQRALSVSL